MNKGQTMAESKYGNQNGIEVELGMHLVNHLKDYVGSNCKKIILLKTILQYS